MEDIDEQIIKHKNNIINATNKIKEINNINELNEINNSIKLENEFLFSLMSIKSKIGNIKLKKKTTELNQIIKRKLLI